jgi:hypothetical protein
MNFNPQLGNFWTWDSPLPFLVSFGRKFENDKVDQETSRLVIQWRIELAGVGIPTGEELTVLTVEYLNNNLADYLSVVQGLPAGNIFSTTVAVEVPAP